MIVMSTRSESVYPADSATQLILLGDPNRGPGQVAFPCIDEKEAFEVILAGVLHKWMFGTRPNELGLEST